MPPPPRLLCGGTGVLETSKTGQQYPGTCRALGSRARPYPDVVEGVALVVWVIDEAVSPVVPLGQWDPQPGVHVLQKLAAVLDSLQGRHPG